jgi:Mor family transcriptional regulator
MESYDLSKSEWENIIDEYIFGKNCERDRAILKDRLLLGMCYEPLSEKYGLSVQHTKNIVRKGADRISRHIKD